MDRIAPPADLALLKRFLGLDSHGAGHLGPAYYRDTLFLAIDFEGREDAHGVSQIGVSILDTRGLPYAALLGQTLIDTQQYCVAKRKEHRRLDKKIKEVFTLGEVHCITREEKLPTLAAIFQQCNSYSILEKNAALSQISLTGDALTGPRNVVLVGHNLCTELRNMDLIGFRPESYANIVAYVDTRTLCQEVHGYCRTLRSVVRQAGLCPRKLYIAGAFPKARNFHIAGNDTAYTLEALLLLVATEHAEAVSASTAGWMGLTRMSAGEAVALASSQLLSQESGPGQKRKWYNFDQNEPTSRSRSKRLALELPVGAEQSTVQTPVVFDEFDELPQQHLTRMGAADVTPAFLLAAARWQMAKEPAASTDCDELDAQARAAVGLLAYGTAICAMPLYFALAPPWHLTSVRV
ncbi:MAG: hypothetical protein LQ337_004107 [Flavoplaca oasis]|nr:MAG: hypothetical protein LQ337_004107 [Flavoplaca oasis]